MSAESSDDQSKYGSHDVRIALGFAHTFCECLNGDIFAPDGRFGASCLLGERTLN